VVESSTTATAKLAALTELGRFNDPPTNDADIAKVAIDFLGNLTGQNRKLQSHELSSIRAAMKLVALRGSDDGIAYLKRWIEADDSTREVACHLGKGNGRQRAQVFIEKAAIQGMAYVVSPRNLEYLQQRLRFLQAGNKQRYLWGNFLGAIKYQMDTLSKMGNKAPAGPENR
jgi:hypothetical protein